MNIVLSILQAIGAITLALVLTYNVWSFFTKKKEEAYVPTVEDIEESIKYTKLSLWHVERKIAERAEKQKILRYLRNPQDSEVIAFRVRGDIS